MHQVLIVEDERIVALTIRQMLETLGYSVAGTASTGQAAIDAAGSLRPDIIVMDMQLPGPMSGTEAAHQISERLEIPVVFLTAYTEEEMLRRALASKPYGYLVKPVEAKELHAALQLALTRHEAERAIGRSEERLRLALDAAKMGALEWEPATGRLITDGHMHAILGTSPPEPSAMTWRGFLDLIHPEDQVAVARSLEQAFAQSQPMEVLFRSQTGADQVRWIQAHAMTHGGQSARRLVGVLQDVTHRRRVEQRLKLAAALFETTAEGVFVTDADFRIVSVNAAFTALTGYSAVDSIGCETGHLLGIDYAADWVQAGNWCKNVHHWKGEARLRRSGGETFPVSISLTAVCEAERLKHIVAAFSDITRIRRAELDLDYIAHHDALTGLPNRLLFNDRLDQSLERAALDNRHRVVLFLDLDDFKVINDVMGHSGGDTLLQIVAMRIAGAVSRGDTVARQGGDEFVAVIENLDSVDDANRIAVRLLDAISAPIDIGGETVRVTASIGISLYPTDGSDRHALLRAADSAMYCAKALGRNRHCIFDKSIADSAAKRIGIEHGLRRALQNGTLVLHFQPIFSVQDEKLTGVEALIRWPHPNKGLLLPEDFIPVAEDTGIIEGIDEWVLHTACTTLAGWFKRGGPQIRLAVNISARQIARERFLKTMRDTLAETGFPANLLELEITETSLQRIEPRASILPAIRALGSRVAIDDFGTGYSSLGRLRTLPFDRIKVDRSFVGEVPDNLGDLAIVTAIIGLSHTLGLQCTAEGVETRSQFEVLKQLGCDEVQGFLLGRPVPFEEISRMVNC